ncbi:glycosyltransferase [Salinivibrio sp. YCSC6]|uniref:glycosyltransferase n=1 Tax=Salinivibrio sp. YCSC6 TaxID=2003370 RepID=UPI000BBCA189|nr:glycosyltransferase [Salinivibrio sp. YCSC6]PCE67654.1 glycosyl transferase family 2 [Salinivibrio sp. YCSC6]QCF35446.1 glycosyltransferase [Salinivibrio sp. YCSC6]
MTKSELFVSVVFVADNCVEKLRNLIEEVSPYLDMRYSDYEIVVIDQKSSDATENEMDKLLSTYQSIRYLRLAQKVSNDVALAAGIENAIGDFVVVLNVETDKKELIEKFVEMGRLGTDIVIGTSTKITSVSYRCLRILSNRLLKSIGYTLPSNSTGSFCLSRRAVNAITESGRFYCKLHMRMANTGYSIGALNYDISQDEVKRRTVSQGLAETFHHMVFNSTKPLRWMSAVGILGSGLSLMFSLYSLLINIFHNQVAEGWTTIVVFMSLLFMLLFTMLSFFGEYLARLLDDRSEHKEYNVVFEKNSSVMINENRQNVIDDSVQTNINLSQTGRDK